jgi:hypothetical protein
MATIESDSNGAGWSKIVSTIGTLLMPLVLLYLGHIYKEAEEKAGLQEHYVELALNILEDESNSQNPHLREWAIEIVHHYSPVDVTADLKDHLMEHGYRLTESD